MSGGLDRDEVALLRVLAAAVEPLGMFDVAASVNPQREIGRRKLPGASVSAS